MASLGALVDWSCKLFRKLLVALKLMEVAILEDDFVEIVERIDVVGGFETFLVVGAPLLALFLVGPDRHQG